MYPYVKTLRICKLVSSYAQPFYVNVLTHHDAGLVSVYNTAPIAKDLISLMVIQEAYPSHSGNCSSETGACPILECFVHMGDILVLKYCFYK